MSNILFSYFRNPITTRIPSMSISLAQLYQMITADEYLQAATAELRKRLGEPDEYRRMKTQRLPFVTPAGVFGARNSKGLITPSREFVVDIDHLESYETACQVRDRLFADNMLAPDLAFVSPSGTGVKLFVPYRMDAGRAVGEQFAEAIGMAWRYIAHVHELGPYIDTANRDIARCCLVSHDADARMRTQGGRE